MSECLYDAGGCDHGECAAWPSDDPYLHAPAPTIEDECGSGGHPYYGDDGDHGRCYCGARLYPLGGATHNGGQR